MDRDELGPHIIKVAESKGVSKSELARRLGIARQNIQGYARGKTAPTFLLAIKIADALGVSLDRLAGREGE